jgi:hypothetical protein
LFKLHYCHIRMLIVSYFLHMFDEKLILVGKNVIFLLWGRRGTCLLLELSKLTISVICLGHIGSHERQFFIVKMCFCGRE